MVLLLPLHYWTNQCLSLPHLQNGDKTAHSSQGLFLRNEWNNLSNGAKQISAVITPCKRTRKSGAEVSTLLTRWGFCFILVELHKISCPDLIFFFFFYSLWLSLVYKIALIRESPRGPLFRTAEHLGSVPGQGTEIKLRGTAKKNQPWEFVKDPITIFLFSRAM